MNPMKQIGSLSLKKHPVQDHRLQKRVSWIITYACLTLGFMLMVRAPPGLFHLF